MATSPQQLSSTRMIFDKITIVAEPWRYVSLGDCARYELRITVRLQGHEIVKTIILEEDDFESRFDFTFDRAKEALRHELQKLKGAKN